MNHTEFLSQKLQRNGSMLRVRAVELLRDRGLSQAQADKLIDTEGARGGAWSIEGPSLYSKVVPLSRVVSSEAAEMSLADAIRQRGSMYVDGAVAALADQGIEPLDARKMVERAITGGSVRVRGTTLVAVAEEGGAVDFEQANEQLFGEERLTAAVRKRMPAVQFAWPERRWGPLVDPRNPESPSHAKNAMGRLTQAYKAGRIDARTYTKVRANILRAYKRYGVVPRAPSALAGPAPAVHVRRAAEEPAIKEANMLTKSQRRAIALKNLKKAWKATGAKGGGGGKGRRPSGRGHSRGRGRAHEAGESSVGERKPGGKGLTDAQRREIAIKNLQRAWASPKMGTPVRAAGKPAAAPVRAPAPAGKGGGKGGGAGGGKGKGGRRRGVTVPSGRFLSPKTGAIITIKRVYPKENPILTRASEAVGLVAGLGVAAFASDWVDRMIATRAPEGATDPRYGVDAAMAIRTKPDAMRMGAQFAGAAVFGAAGYGLSKVSPTAGHTAYGMAIAFGLRFLWQVLGGHVLPAVFKAASPAEKTFSNRYYADLQDWSQMGAQPATPATPAQPATPQASGVAGGLPRGVASLMPGYGMAYGPVATGVGSGGAAPGCPTCNAKSGGCGCGKSKAPMPTPAQPPVGVPALPEGNGGGMPRFEVQPTPDVVPTVTKTKEPELADLIRLQQSGRRGSSVMSLLNG